MKIVEPYKTSLSAGNAYWMARLSEVAYFGDSDGNPQEAVILENLKTEDSKFLSVIGTSSNSAQAILVEHEDYFAFAFRGTDRLEDWLDNLDVFPEEVLLGKFHRGFFRSLKDVWEPLYRCYLELRLQKKRPLFLTGHSLGGAIATVGAAYLIHHDLPFTAVYTFGQPRAMNHATARIFNVEAKSKFFRFQNNNDLVTRAPARLMGYSHVGTYLHITEDKVLHPEPGFWLRFLDAIDGAVEALKEKGIDGVEDHKMQDYLSAVHRWQVAVD